MERIKVDLIDDPNIAYQRVDVDNYNEEMNLRPLNSNPFQNFRIPSNYLVNDAKILGMSNLILNKKNICAINNIVFNIRNNNKIFHESEKSITYDNKNIFFDVINEENISKGVFLGSNWNYGHWLFNHLARLYYCQSSYKDCHIIVNNSIDAEKFEVLKYFNIPKENIKILNSGTLLNVEKLIIPQMPWHSLNGLLWWAPNSFKFLRESLGCNKILNSECKLNIFITRSTARWRKVTNEIQLFNIAKKYNFELIDIGTLTVDEQINLGRQTRNLISPFGANSNFFINIPSGAKFLELAPPLDRMNVSGPFSVASQIEYIQLIGRPDKKENQRDLDSDYIIDESVFQKKIQEFCDID
tara:strand:- start:965 stop:2032 length:1068 start_codon:yes stop_codon:yes gene_type:complete